MANPLKALFALDEAITNSLTKFCWWTDKHFEKDNIFWFKVSFYFLNPLLVVVLEMLFQKHDSAFTALLSFLKECALQYMVLYVCYRWILPIKSIIDNANTSPNKNRFATYAYFAKFVIFVSVLIQPLFFYHMFPKAVPGSVQVMHLVYLLCIYFLCTEPLPPAMRKKKEEGKLILST